MSKIIVVNILISDVLILKPFIMPVISALAAKAITHQANMSTLEQRIDNLAYRLYNLTCEEVRVIEPGFPLSKAEYEGIDKNEK
ncbi:MAG: hypothetical protein LBE13_21330 [Bacteroidales bacterium]|nr:hypothetical protein [Bacteroidales bacterium]